MTNLCFQNIITYYAPRVFETLGITGTSTKLFSTGFYGIAKTLGMCTFTFYVVEKVGRRKGLLWGAALGCIPMLYIGGYVSKVGAVSLHLAADSLLIYLLHKERSGGCSCCWNYRA
jgi:hypothetical protein